MNNWFSPINAFFGGFGGFGGFNMCNLFSNPFSTSGMSMFGLNNIWSTFNCNCFSNNNYNFSNLASNSVFYNLGFDSFWNNSINAGGSGTGAVKAEKPTAKISKTEKYEYVSPSNTNEYTQYASENGIHETKMPDGSKVLACRWSKFEKCQPEWIELQQHMLKAAKDLGLTLVYSDVTRTVAASNAGRAKKGNLVLAGGESPHNYGVAADIVLVKDGKVVNPNSKIQTDFANKVREYSNNRIEWGGEWNKKGERHHFQIRNWKGKYKNSKYLVG